MPIPWEDKLKAEVEATSSNGIKVLDKEHSNLKDRIAMISFIFALLSIFMMSLPMVRASLVV